METLSLLISDIVMGRLCLSPNQIGGEVFHPVWPPVDLCLGANLVQIVVRRLVARHL